MKRWQQRSPIAVAVRRKCLGRKKHCKDTCINSRGYIAYIWDTYLYMIGFAVWICFSTMRDGLLCSEILILVATCLQDHVFWHSDRWQHTHTLWAFISLQHFCCCTIVYQQLQRWMTIRLNPAQTASRGDHDHHNHTSLVQEQTCIMLYMILIWYSMQ